MICTCPKCHGQIELDLPEVTEAGTTAVCPACNGKFNVHRESFGGRALRKPHEISCASCGNQLGPEMHCQSCGAQFPDYVVVSIGRRKVRRTGKKVKLKFSPFPQPSKATTQLPSLDMAMRPDVAGKAAPLAAASRLPRGMIIAISLLVLVLAAAGGTFLYQKKQAEDLYARNFVLASFCLQTGFERAQKASTRILAEWKEKTDAGQFYAPRPSLDDDRDFGIINSKYDQALSKLGTTPEKFANCTERLNKLQGPYIKLRSLVMAPGTSQPGFSEAKTKIEGEYKQAIREYRAGMPDEMLEKLTSESLKFKGLKVLLQ